MEKLYLVCKDDQYFGAKMPKEPKDYGDSVSETIKAYEQARADAIKNKLPIINNEIVAKGYIYPEITKDGNYYAWSGTYALRDGDHELGYVLSLSPAAEPADAAPGELKPCPFCGREPEWITAAPTEYTIGFSQIRCLYCKIGMIDDNNKVINAWNVRATKHAHDDIVRFIKVIRDSFEGTEFAYSHGSCYKFHLILNNTFGGEPWHNGQHVITMIEDKYYDIRGEIAVNELFRPLSSWSESEQRLVKHAIYRAL